MYKRGDDVTFIVDKTKYNYRVQDSFLSNREGVNEAIFEALGIKDKVGFCSECYGYQPHHGDFPECNCGDYQALNRCIDKLLSMCNPVPFEYDSKIVFSGGILKAPVECTVATRYLNTYKEHNAAIFEYLGMSTKKTMEYIEKAYGYRPKTYPPSWPAFKYEDYDALKRLLEQLNKDYDLTIEIDGKVYLSGSHKVPSIEEKEAVQSTYPSKTKESSILEPQELKGGSEELLRINHFSLYF